MSSIWKSSWVAFLLLAACGNDAQPSANLPSEDDINSETAASVVESAVPTPITFLGINAMMPEGEIEIALRERGYECSMRDEVIERLAKLVCSKRTGDSPYGGAFANITVNIEPKPHHIDLSCLAIADGLGDRDVSVCYDSPDGSLSLPVVAERLVKLGVIKREYQGERTGDNFCVTSSLGDKMCVFADQFSEQTRMYFYRP